MMQAARASAMQRGTSTTCVFERERERERERESYKGEGGKGMVEWNVREEKLAERGARANCA